MRPISFKRVSKAQKEEFIREVMAEVDKHVEPRINRETAERVSEILVRGINIPAIELAFGRMYLWRGVPVTPDQFEALENGIGRRIAA